MRTQIPLSNCLSQNILFSDLWGRDEGGEIVICFLFVVAVVVQPGYIRLHFGSWWHDDVYAMQISLLEL